MKKTFATLLYLFHFVLAGFLSLVKRVRAEIVRWSSPPLVTFHNTAIATFFRWFNLALLRRGGLAALIALLFGFGLNARAQLNAINLLPITNMPPTLASNVVNCATNPSGQLVVYPLTKNCCLSLAGRAWTSLGTGQEIVSGYFLNDNTNLTSPWSLVANLSTTVPTNTFGFPTNTVFTNWSQAQLSGYSGVAVTQVTNTGPGTATNSDWKFNRPTLSTQTY